MPWSFASSGNPGGFGMSSSGNPGGGMQFITPPTGIIVNGLVLNLDAGNVSSYPGSGTTWTDLSGNNNTGTLTNGPTFSTGNGGSIILDGVDDYVNVPMTFNPSAFTVSIWILLSSTVTSPNIFATVTKEGFNSGFGINILGSNFGNFNSQLEFFIGTGTAVTTVRNTASAISANVWYNFVGVYNGSTISVYQNAVLQNSRATSTISYSNNNFNIGRSAEFLRYTPARIAITSLYSRALTDSEILQNFNTLRSRFGI